MNFMLDIDKSQYADKIIKTAGFGDTVAFGAKILLIGIATVFAVLCLIWLCLSVFKVAFSRNSEKSVKATKIEAEPVAVAPVAVSDDSEIIAVIAAAIAAAESESTGGAKFRVVSFRRK